VLVCSASTFLIEILGHGDGLLYLMFIGLCIIVVVEE